VLECSRRRHHPCWETKAVDAAGLDTGNTDCAKIKKNNGQKLF
jgi:hypothetical protein